MLCYVQASFSMVFVVFCMVFDPVFEALPVKTPCLCNGFVGHALKPRTCAAGGREVAADKLTRLAKHRACAVNVFSEKLGPSSARK
jgi:hypothetical protein